MTDNESPAALVTSDIFADQSSEPEAPVAEPKITPAQEAAEVAKVASAFASIKGQAMVRIRVPKVYGPQVVIINGARFNIPSNISIEVPEQVAQILADSGRI